ncbi:hypothetical protein [Vreelandella boliviensis]|uniref:hypothetical protein n=1 Tax=Vreelandella boliviensis TaxID=223527 RepID=UPI001140D7AF|nr:hypothetical protein [Halomonas boliviensis]
MLNSRKEQDILRRSSLPRCDNDDVSEGSPDDSLKGSIPTRYRDARGGIDLKRVQLDQHKARRRVIQALIRRIQHLWSR